MNETKMIIVIIIIITEVGRNFLEDLMLARGCSTL